MFRVRMFDKPSFWFVITLLGNNAQRADIDWIQENADAHM